MVQLRRFDFCGRVPDCVDQHQRGKEETAFYECHFGFQGVQGIDAVLKRLGCVGKERVTLTGCGWQEMDC